MTDALVRTYAYLSPGGPVMGLIALASIVCLALVIERWIALRRERVVPNRLMEAIEGLARERKFSEAEALCRSGDSAVARILAAGFAVAGAEKGEIRETLELAGRREASRLEKNLDFLGTLAAVGPLLGLLGTVTGMIRTFGAIKLVGVGDPLQLSAGIGEALLNTAGGLIVGIPALVAQRYFFRKVDRMVLEMEEFAQLILRFLKG
jgi:biopolymer transport protein ExbB